MAARTVAVGQYGSNGVIGSGAKPAAGGMAALATIGHPGVDRRRGLAGHSIRSCQMAGLALGRHRNIGVETSRIPGSVPAFVAGIAVVGASDGGISVAGNLAICWR